MANLRARAGVLLAGALTGSLMLGSLAGCATTEQPGPTGAPESATAPTPDTSAAAADPDHAVAGPGELELPLYPSDLLVTRPGEIGEEEIDRIAGLDGVTGVTPLSIAQVAVGRRVLTVAAVDAGQYRRYTPAASAQTQTVWDRVAGGEVAVEPALGRRLEAAGGYLRLGNDADAPRVHIGAYAPQVPRIDAVVNHTWGAELGLDETNALIVTTGMRSPQSVRDPLQDMVGDQTSVQVLGPDLDVNAAQTAFLTGGSVAEAVGSFRYSVLDGGRIAPDGAWVSANIETREMPILGEMTCHRIVFDQLEAALTEIVDRGLADKLHPDEYAGCYYPRFIAGTNSLSLHSFGIAFDVNVPGNQRGTEGDIDRQVVDIFKRWGFEWGGDWNYTDPMHFQMDAIVEPR